MEELLKEILSRDKSILARRDDLIKILDDEVPNNQRRTYAAIRKALTLNVGEIFLVSDFSDWEKQERARQILKESGMQDAKIDEVINIFANVFKLNAQLKYTLEDRIKSIEENLKLCFIDEKILLRVKNLENKITENETLKKRIADLEKIITSLKLENSALEMRFERLANDFNKTPPPANPHINLSEKTMTASPKTVYTPRTQRATNTINTPKNISAGEDFLRDYNIWQSKTDGFEKNNARKDFIAKYKVRYFNCVNYNERMNQPQLPPIFEESSASGDYWAIQTAENTFKVVPNVKSYNDNYHVARAMCELFDSNFDAGNYVNIQLERAAEFTNSGQNWTLIRKGKLILR